VAADPDRLERLLADLDSNTFRTRQAARKELEGLGVAAEPALRQRLLAKPSVEVVHQVKRLLGRLEAEMAAPGEHLQSLRAVEALERAGGRAARDLLRRVAAGAKDAGLTREARGALRRMSR
jgi:hypothetical protein